MLFKNETTCVSMLAVGQTSILIYAIRRRRTYRQRKKPCIDKPEAVKCAVRHRRCEGCPFKNFFKADNPLKYIDNV